MDYKTKELRKNSGGEAVGIYPTNDYVVIELDEYKEAVLAGDTEKAAEIKAGGLVKTTPIFLGDELAKEKAKEVEKELSYKVVAVPVDYIARPEVAKCQIGDYLFLQGRAAVERLEVDGKVYGMVPGRTIIAATTKDFS